MGLSLGSASGFGESPVMSAEFQRRIFPYRVFYNWEITRYCDYGCLYCNSYDTKKHEVRNEEQVISAWEKLYKKYGYGHIRISGGEPTTYPGFFQLIRKLTDYFTLELTTNLNFNTELLTEIFTPEQIDVSASYHPEFVNVEEFLRKASLIRDAGFSKMSVTIVVFPFLLDNLIYNAEKIVSAGFQLNIQHYSGKFNEKNYPDYYNEDEQEIIRKAITISGNEYNNEIFTSKNVQVYSSGRICRMGHSYVKIVPDGNAFRCCHYEAESIGNIFNEGFKLLDEPAPCFLEQCPCYKAMIDDEEERWMKMWKDYPVHPKQRTNDRR